MRPKDYVFALRLGELEKAWPLSTFEGGRVINDTLGDFEVVLIGEAATRTVRAYRAGGHIRHPRPGPARSSLAANPGESRKMRWLASAASGWSGSPATSRFGSRGADSEPTHCYSMTAEDEEDLSGGAKPNARGARRSPTGRRVELPLDGISGLRPSNRFQTTVNCPIIPASSCSSTWQWYI